jgi:trans-aconitate methyltransferase
MTHEFDGDKYARASAHQREWGARLISQLTFTGHERVLDLGCGDGVLTAHLAELVPKGSVLGIDASEGMLEAARKHARANLAFELMDINQMNFDAEFDLVFSNATLHWVLDHRRLLANVYSALNDDGIARFNFAAEGNCACFFRVIRDIMARREFSGYFEGFDWPWYMPGLAEYRALLGQLPFKEATVWPENADRHFQDAEALVGWIDQPSIVPFLRCVEEPHKCAFRQVVVERMLRETAQSDGTFFETFRRINVYAVK